MTFGDTPEEPVEDTVEERSVNFVKELEWLINKYSMENGSDTPDFILAEYLFSCMQAFNATVDRRNTWYGIKHMPGGSQIIDGDEDTVI